MTDAGTTVSVIVISYNTRDLTLRCLHALHEDLSSVKAEVWVVDNASNDGSAQAIQTRFPGVRLIVNGHNLGFGAANNQAMRRASGQYLLLLNSDAFIEGGTVRALVGFLERHPNVAAVGPRLVNIDGGLQMSCYPFPSPMRAWIDSLALARFFGHASWVGDFRSWRHDTERLVPWVIGACVMVRRTAYVQVGDFDERFFMYSEETDWQRRMRDGGWEIGFTPAGGAVHLAAGSTSPSRAHINPQFFQSHDLYYRKHFGLVGLIVARVAMVFGCSWRTVGWCLALAVVPSLREKARFKVRLNSWLAFRQAFHWRLAGERRAMA